MSRFAVSIVTPTGSPHWKCLVEVAEGIRYALAQLAHDVAFSAHPTPPLDAGRLIVFNAHRLDPKAVLPADAIIFNAEQIPVGDYADDPVTMSSWAPYLARLKQHVVWDYSAVNAERLRAIGAPKVVHCPIGYYPGLRVSETTANEDVDVLLVGSMNARREKILAGCAMRGLRVKHLFGVYGADRDAWIARSKVQLNVHFYPNPIWEIFRCSYLIANGRCVVSEDGGCDPALEVLAKASCAHVAYDAIVETCDTLVREPARRQAIADCGKTAFRARYQVEYVRAALEVT